MSKTELWQPLLPPQQECSKTLPMMGGIIQQPPGRNSTGLQERQRGVAWCVPLACQALQPANPAP